MAQHLGQEQVPVELDQAHGGHHRVDQQPQGAIGRQPDSGDARPDDDRHEQAGAGELGQQPPAHRSIGWANVICSGFRTL
jgi:hypothetical protein